MTQPAMLPWRTRPPRSVPSFHSPAVRSLAHDLGVDLSTVSGTGTDGRVTATDVRVASETRDIVVPFDNIRRRTSVALLASKQTIPHALTAVAADYTAVDSARHTVGLTALPFVARAVIDALREYPLMNATTAEDGVSVVTHRAVHLGIAVDLEFQGLVVPVVHDADGLRLRALASAIRDLASRARARKLGPDDLAGGTFTITNPGASGTWISFPVINRPQVGILSTDGVTKLVRADGDGLRIAPIGHLCCSFDHRAVDRPYAGSFVARVQAIVETRDWFTEL
jgi:2-oxoglutarate dehydrogenase E2 component (dihydrolipoamide succinyltransferase)